MAAVMLKAKPIFYTRETQQFFSNYAHQYEKYLVTEHYCVASPTAENCPLCDSRFYLLLIGRTSKKHVFDKFNEFQFTYQFVVYFCTVFRIDIQRKSLYKDKTLFSIKSKITVNFNQYFKGNALLREFLESDY